MISGLYCLVNHRSVIDILIKRDIVKVLSLLMYFQKDLLPLPDTLLLRLLEYGHLTKVATRVHNGLSVIKHSATTLPGRRCPRGIHSPSLLQILLMQVLKEALSGAFPALSSLNTIFVTLV